MLVVWTETHTDLWCIRIQCFVKQMGGPARTRLISLGIAIRLGCCTESFDTYLFETENWNEIPDDPEEVAVVVATVGVFLRHYHRSSKRDVGEERNADESLRCYHIRLPCMTDVAGSL